MFMELSFGQYASLGPVAIYKKFCPLFRGLGYGMVIVSAIVMLYYNLIIAWTLFYMFASFNSVLPWQKCEEWSTIREYIPVTDIHVHGTQPRVPMLPLWTLFYMFASFNSVLPWQKCEEWSTIHEYIPVTDTHVHGTQPWVPMLPLWTLFYMFASFNSVLPLQKCEEWSTIREYIPVTDIHVHGTQQRVPMLPLRTHRVLWLKLWDPCAEVRHEVAELRLQLWYRKWEGERGCK
jgi:hypothetical protein